MAMGWLVKGAERRAWWKEAARSWPILAGERSNYEGRLPKPQESASKPMVAVPEEPESGVLDAFRAMGRIF